MGTLAVMHYPTPTFANLADHTYVRCGTGGRAWSCWGGKTGGTELRAGVGSTRRANAIAEPNERGGITCYLINGVCHQSANRILLPAAITAQGARGYEVSEALFGPYGRPRGPFGTCRAPFDQHPGVTGDLPECADGVRMVRARGRSSAARRVRARPPRQEARYIREVLAVYRRAQPRTRAGVRGLRGPELERFHLRLFMLQVQYRLGSRVGRSRSRWLQDIRLSTERSRMKIEEWYGHREMTAGEFVRAFNTETVLFQDAAAGALDTTQYHALFGLAPGDTVVLADPRVLRKALRRKAFRRR